VLALLSSFCSWVIREGLADTNPVRPALRDPDVKALLASTHDKETANYLKSWSEVDRLYKALGRTSVGGCFYLHARAGLRSGEAMALRWGSVDLGAKVLTVRASVRSGKVGPPKSGKPRKVPIAPKLGAELAKGRPQAARARPTTRTSSAHRRLGSATRGSSSERRRSAPRSPRPSRRPRSSPGKYTTSGGTRSGRSWVCRRTSRASAAGDHVVETIPADGADHALGEGIGRGRARRSGEVSGAESADAAQEVGAYHDGLFLARQAAVRGRVALRQQLINLRRTSRRARLRNCDRAFWLVLSRFWSRWVDVLVVVKPDTVVRWHRAGFRLFWRWKSRSGSPSDGGVSQETKRLIRQMAESNVGWGAPRITANC
jgi:hypothetical protein